MECYIFEGFKMPKQELFFDCIIVKKRTKNRNPHKNKKEIINKTIKKWNTEKHIYRYQTLYKIYSKIFLLSYKEPAEGVSYLIEEDGGVIAEINNTWEKPIKERILLHIKLLRQILNNSYKKAKNTKINVESNQTSFFTNSTIANL